MIKNLWQNNRWECLWVMGFVLIATILCSLMLNPTMTVVNHDAAIFALLGQSIALGEGYFLNSPPQPQPYFTFPPGFGLQIAVIMKLIGSTVIPDVLIWLKGWMHLLFVATIPLFYWWVRRHFSVKLALISTALLTLSPLVYKYSSDLLSDVPYWGISFGAIFAYWRWQVVDSRFTDKKPKRWWVWLITALALIFLSVLTRQIGVALGIAIITHSLWTLGKQQKRWGLSALITVIMVVGMAAWPTYEHYYRSTNEIHLDTLNQADVDTILDQSPVKLEFIKHFVVENPVSQDTSRTMTGLSDYTDLIQQRVTQYAKATIDVLLPPVWVKSGGIKQNASRWLYPLVLIFAVLGFWPFAKRAPLVAIYMVLFLGVLAVYPYYSPRFVVSMMPFMLMLVFLGANLLLEKIPKLKLRQAMTVILLGVVLFGGHLPDTLRWVKAGYRLKDTNGVPSLRPHNRAFYDTNLWIKANLPDTALVLSRKPPVTYYFSGHHSVGFIFTADQPRLMHFIEEKRSKYSDLYSELYVIDDGAFSESKKFLAPLIAANPERFELVYQHPTFEAAKVWKLKPDNS